MLCQSLVFPPLRLILNGFVQIGEKLSSLLRNFDCFTENDKTHQSQ